ncbi:hypothetical protein RFI_18202, partial [Reticulomyxa filosa]
EKEIENEHEKEEEKKEEKDKDKDTDKEEEEKREENADSIADKDSEEDNTKERTTKKDADAAQCATNKKRKKTRVRKRGKSNPIPNGIEDAESKRKTKTQNTISCLRPLAIHTAHVREKTLTEVSSIPVIICTGLSDKQAGVFKEFTKKFADRVIVSDVWKNFVTHLVTSATIDNGERTVQTRTMKYIKMVVAGGWILCFDWIEQCLKENELLDELPFEVAGDTKGFNASKTSRENREEHRNTGLFKNCVALIGNKFTISTLPRDLKSVFWLGGGQVLKRLPLDWEKAVKAKKEFKDESKCYVYVCEKEQNELESTETQFCQKFGISILDYTVVLDAISKYQPLA